MKKIFISIVVAIILSACSHQYDNDLGNIEDLLKIDLKNYDFEIKKREHGIGFGEESVTLSLAFSDKDFGRLLNKLDIDKWEKVNLNNELKNSYDYSINYINRDIKIWMFLNLKEKSLKYSYYED